MEIANQAEIDLRTDALRKAVDAYIDATGLDVPTDEPLPDATLGGRDIPDSPETLELHAIGVASVVWETGFAWDFAWLQVPVLDAAGAPRNIAGLCPCTGLYFAGMSVVDPLSTSIGRVGVEAERSVGAISAPASV